MEDHSFLTNLETIRQNARQHMDKGPVTSAYGLDPALVCRVLNEVLATEITCALRYKAHYHIATGIGAETVAAEFLEHAREEEAHADRVAERISQLGGAPDFNPSTFAQRSHAEFKTSGSLRDLITEDLVAERIAVQTYQEIVRWLGDKDPTTRRLMEDLLAKEEEHADDLLSLLARDN